MGYDSFIRSPTHHIHKYAPNGLIVAGRVVSDVPGCGLTANAVTTALHATPIAVQFQVERWDVGSYHSTVTNNERITPTVAGYHLVIAAVQIAANINGVRQLSLRMNGSQYLRIQSTVALTGGENTNLDTPAEIYFNGTTDYIEAVVYQTSGLSLNVQNIADYSPEFSCRLLSER